MSKKQLDAIRQAFSGLTRDELLGALKEAIERKPSLRDQVVDAVVKFMAGKKTCYWESAQVAFPDLVRIDESLYGTDMDKFSVALLDATLLLSEHGIELRSQERLSGEREFALIRVGAQTEASKPVTPKRSSSPTGPYFTASRADIAESDAEKLAQTAYVNYGSSVLFSEDFHRIAKATNTFPMVTKYFDKVSIGSACAAVLERLAKYSYNGYRYAVHKGRRWERMSWQVLRDERAPAPTAQNEATSARPASATAEISSTPRGSKNSAKKTLRIDATDIALAVETGANLGPGPHTPKQFMDALEREGMFCDELNGRSPMGRSILAGRILRAAKEATPAGYRVELTWVQGGCLKWSITRAPVSIAPKADADALAAPVVVDAALAEPQKAPEEAKVEPAVDADEKVAASADDDPQPYKLANQLQKLNRLSLLRPIVIFGGVVDPRKLEWARSTNLNIEWLPAHREHGSANAQTLARRVLDRKIAAVIFLNELFGHRDYQPVMDAARARSVKVAYAGKGGQGALRSALFNLESQLAGEESTSESA